MVARATATRVMATNSCFVVNCKLIFTIEYDPSANDQVNVVRGFDLDVQTSVRRALTFNVLFAGVEAEIDAPSETIRTISQTRRISNHFYRCVGR